MELDSWSQQIDQRILIKTKGRINLHVFCVLIEDIQLLSDILMTLKAEISMFEKSQGLLKFKIKIFDGSHNFILKQINEEGWLLVSESKSRVNKKLFSEIWKRYPAAFSRIYLSSSQIRQLYEKFCSSREFLDYYVTSFYAKRQSETIGDEILPKVTLAIWQKNAESRFKEYERMKAYLTRLEFKGIEKERIYKCSITRWGKITLIHGLFSPLIEELVIPALNQGLNNLNFWKKRERKVVRGEVHLRPVEYHLDFNLTATHFEALENAIGEVGVYTLIQKGNPYFLASCYDKRDQSVYRVAATGKRVVIIPMGRATDVALQRLFVTISDYFVEESPRDYEKKEEVPWRPISHH